MNLAGYRHQNVDQLYTSIIEYQGPITMQSLPSRDTTAILIVFALLH